MLFASSGELQHDQDFQDQHPAVGPVLVQEFAQIAVGAVQRVVEDAVVRFQAAELEIRQFDNVERIVEVLLVRRSAAPRPSRSLAGCGRNNSMRPDRFQPPAAATDGRYRVSRPAALPHRAPRARFPRTFGENCQSSHLFRSAFIQ